MGAGWVCGRVFYGCISVKCVLLGYFDGIFLGQVNGYELSSSYLVSLEKFERNPNMMVY